MASSPKVSVIIPTADRCHFLKRTLASLAFTDFDRAAFEVIVVDDSSNDATPSMLSEFSGSYLLKVIPAASMPRSAARARNLGSHAAAGELLLFLDSDMLASPDLLTKHAQYHREEEIVVLGYRYRARPGISYPEFNSIAKPAFRSWLAAQSWEPDERDDYVKRERDAPLDLNWSCLYSHNVSISHSRFLEVGGFDPGFRGCGAEDVELGYRLTTAGSRLVYAPDAIGYHQFHPRTATRWRDNFYNIDYLVELHPELTSFRADVLKEWQAVAPLDLVLQSDRER